MKEMIVLYRAGAARAIVIIIYAGQHNRLSEKPVMSGTKTNLREFFKGAEGPRNVNKEEQVSFVVENLCGKGANKAALSECQLVNFIQLL